MTRAQLYEDALTSIEPVWEPRGVARSLLAQGVDRDELVRELTEIALEPRHANREADEDAVTEAVDFPSGWCSPFMKL